MNRVESDPGSIERGRGSLNAPCQESLDRQSARCQWGECLRWMSQRRAHAIFEGLCSKQTLGRNGKSILQGSKQGTRPFPGRCPLLSGIETEPGSLLENDLYTKTEETQSLKELSTVERSKPTEAQAELP